MTAFSEIESNSKIICWLGKNSSQPSSFYANLQSACHKMGWILSETPSRGAFVFITAQDVDPVIANQIRAAYPWASWIYFVEGSESSQLLRVINERNFNGFLSSQSELSDFLNLLTKAIETAQRALERQERLRVFRQETQELEVMTESLEKLVEQKTEDLHLSKNRQEEKNQKIRSLIQFIWELSRLSSFEEILELVRKSFRGYHQINQVLLLYQLQEKKPEILFFKNSQVQTKLWNQPFADVPSIHLQDPQLRLQLANYFGRPFGKVLVFPVHLMNKTPILNSQFLLVIENSMAEAEASEVVDVCLDRLQPLATALERLQIERELIHASYRWEKTFDGFRDPIVIVDRNDFVLRANKKFSEQASEGPCYQIFAGRSSRCPGCPVPQALESHQPMKSQVRRGDSVFEVHSYPIHLSANGPPTNFVNQYVDVTQNQALYARLLQAEKMGALGLLAANIAHELNNPLTGLRSLAQVLQMTLPAGSLRSDLQEIEKAAERSQKVIRNLLDFVSQEEISQEPVLADDLIEKTMPFLKTRFRRLRVVKKFLAREAFIKVEPNLFQQVLFNLMNNACQAMGETGTLTLQTEAEQSQLIISVMDTGPGIPEQDREKVFEPFYTTKAENEGTGLGLSLSRDIIAKFGGRIGIDSNPEGGARVWIALPLAEAREGDLSKS